MKDFFKSKHFIIKAVLVSVILLFTVLSFFFADKIELFLHLRGRLLENERSQAEIYAGDYYVSYIDVGQGNSAFVKLPDGKTMIIDGGNTMYGEKVTNYLNSLGITTIDYMIATHADSDHIGGLLSVLANFEVKNIYRPFQISGTGTSYNTFIPSEDEDLKDVYTYYVDKMGSSTKISRVTTKVYSDFISAIYSETYAENNIVSRSSITVFYDGLVISGNGYLIEFYAPAVRSERLNLSTITSFTKGYATVGYGATSSNDNSAIFLLSCQGTTYLFTGDAPYTNKSGKTNNFEESDFIKSLSKLEIERFSNISVYLVGHHGSEYSTSPDLLKIIKPEYAVISVSKNNDYGHPHLSTIKRLFESENLTKDKVLTTKDLGTIVFSGKDKALVFATEYTEDKSKFEISWILLISIISGTIIIIIVSIKPRRNGLR